MAEWTGINDGEPWKLEIEADCMAESEPFTVSVWSASRSQPRGDVMITRWSEVVCDQCSTGCHCMPTAAESRRCAKEEGWIRRKGRDLCPECKGEESQ